MKRAMAGKLPLLAAIKKLMDEVLEPPSFEDDADHSDDPLYAESQLLAEHEEAGSLHRRRGLAEVHERAWPTSRK